MWYYITIVVKSKFEKPRSTSKLHLHPLSLLKPLSRGSYYGPSVKDGAKKGNRTSAFQSLQELKRYSIVMNHLPSLNLYLIMWCCNRHFYFINVGVLTVDLYFSVCGHYLPLLIQLILWSISLGLIYFTSKRWSVSI